MDETNSPVSSYDLEVKLLADLEQASIQLDQSFKKLANIEDTVFEIVKKQVEEKHPDGNYKMDASEAAIIFQRLTDAFIKKQRAKLDTIQVLHGVRKDFEGEQADDIIDDAEDDLSDVDKRGLMQAMTSYLKNRKKTTRHRSKTKVRKKPE